MLDLAVQKFNKKRTLVLRNCSFKFFLSVFGFLFVTVPVGANQQLPNLIKQVKPAIVGVGTHQPTRRPPSKLLGTGFAVVDGRYIVTNHHVLPKELDLEKREQLVVFFKKNKRVIYQVVKIIDTDAKHDLALLKLNKEILPTLSLNDASTAEEGEAIFFTGFPIGAILGLYPATHQGIISAVTPVIIPAPASSVLDNKMIYNLRNPYLVFQLDATAYPGNSGSPLISQNSGKVLGVINKVFIKESKETLLEKPSGITYAIPVQYVINLLNKNKLSIN